MNVRNLSAFRCRHCSLSRRPCSPFVALAFVAAFAAVVIAFAAVVIAFAVFVAAFTVAVAFAVVIAALAALRGSLGYAGLFY